MVVGTVGEEKILKRLDRIIELLEELAETATDYPVQGSITWTGLEDYQVCTRCGQLIPPEGHCDCPGPYMVKVLRD